jgi:hypothetical protein
MHRVLLLAASLVALSGGHAMAGLVVSGTNVDLVNHKAEPISIYVDSDRIKFTQGDETMIYRSDLKSMWSLNPREHSYTEITPQTLQRVNGQLAQARAQAQARFAQMSPEQRARMEAGLARLPPEQRARIEAMMAGKGGGPAQTIAPAQDKITYVRAGGSKTIGRYHCDNYARLVNGKKEQDLCIAPISSVGVRAGDFKVLDDLRAMLGQFQQGNRRGPDYFRLHEMSDAIGFEGIPLETISYSSSGKPETDATITKIARTTNPSTIYELPKGLTKEDPFAQGRP